MARRRDLGNGLAVYAKVYPDHDRHPSVFFAVYRREAAEHSRDRDGAFALLRWEAGRFFSPRPDEALTYQGRPTRRRFGNPRTLEEVAGMFRTMVERFRASVDAPRQQEQDRQQRAQSLLDAIVGGEDVTA